VAKALPDGLVIAVEALPELAERLRERLGPRLLARVNVVVAGDNHVPIEDGCADRVVMVDVLHHLYDQPGALDEVARLLRPGGVAYFREPLDVPLFDRIRNTALGRRLAPKQVGLEHHITEDERKLDAADLELIRRYFPDLRIERSLVFARFTRILPVKDASAQQFDQRLTRLMPFLARFGGAGVVTLPQPQAPRRI